MNLKSFIAKLKLSTFRDVVFVAILALGIAVIELSGHFTENLVTFLYKYRSLAIDDIFISSSVAGIFLLFYSIRRNREKKEIIKKQAQTKAALRKTHYNLQLLLNSSSSILYNTEASAGNKLLYMTKNVTAILGYSKEEYFEPGWWINNIHPQDQVAVQAELESLYAQGSINMEYRFRHKNGNWLWMRSAAQLRYDAQGKPIEIVGTWWDISERKASQEAIRKNNERFNLSFKATKDVLYDWDITANSIWVSEEFYRSFGYAEETNDINLEWWLNKTHPEDADSFNTAIAEALRNRKPEWSREYRFRRADGTYANILSRGYILYAENGDPLRWVGALSDITVSKQTETELREAKEKAEESVKFKSEFLANMSHEIRTPLNGVIGMTELALETDINPQQKRYLENIRSSSETLLSLINDILDFSKIDAGKLELSPVNFSLRDELPQALQSLSLKASEKKLEFVFCLDQNVPDLFFSDVLRLQQVIVNLAGNAIKFTEKGEVAIKCSLKSDTKEEAVLLFSVTDTGVGIPANKLSAIFHEFTQADGTISRQYGGTGLGLTISKRLAEMMGGTIWAESEEGKGSTFYFTICMKLQDIKNKPRFIPGAFLDEKRVLIVEDNKTTRDYTLQVINQFRMRGFAVSSGESALLELEKAVEQNDPYALVLLDINLAKQMDGFDVAAQIKNNPVLKNTEIIVVSMSQKASDRERFGQMGVTKFFSKPFSQSDLLDSIQNALLSSNPVFRQQLDLSKKIKLDGPASSGTLHFLLVEDNIINQEVAANMLMRIGHTVTIANNGVEAVEAIQTGHFDLVLMDVQMPQMNGYEATMTIREKEKNTGKHIHIIGLTANAMKGDREKCLEKGMDDYVSKPIRFNDLTKAIQSFTDKTNIPENNKEEQKEAEKPLVNLQGLFENLNSDEEIFAQFINKFPKHISTSFKKLVQAVAGKSCEDIEFAAHSLRGLCLNLEMYKVTDITLEIEKLASENKLNEVTPLVSLLENELLKALDYMKERKTSIFEAV